MDGQEKTLGRLLKELTAQAKLNVEIEQFASVLKEAAKTGKSAVVFNDIREYLPTMVMNGTLQEWLRSQELTANGMVDSETGAYKYTITWE